MVRDTDEEAGKELSDCELEFIALFPPNFLLHSPQNQGGDNERKGLESLDFTVLVRVSVAMRKHHNHSWYHVDKTAVSPLTQFMEWYMPD